MRCDNVNPLDVHEINRRSASNSNSEETVVSIGPIYMKKKPKPEEEAVREEEFSLIGVSYCPGFNYADVKTATFDVIASCYKRNSPRIEGN